MNNKHYMSYLTHMHNSAEHLIRHLRELIYKDSQGVEGELYDGRPAQDMIDMKEIREHIASEILLIDNYGG